MSVKIKSHQTPHENGLYGNELRKFVDEIRREMLLYREFWVKLNFSRFWHIRILRVLQYLGRNVFDESFRIVNYNCNNYLELSKRQHSS